MLTTALTTNTQFGVKKIDFQKVLLAALAVICLYVLLMNPAFAQVGGATGGSAATSARVVGVVTQFQAIMFAIGGFILAAAFMYVGYAMAFGGKKWSDVANVCYGSVIAGAGAMIVGWLFT